MMRLAIGVCVVLAFLPAGAQSSAPKQFRLDDALPGGIRTTQIALAPDTRRVYSGDSARAVWFFDCDAKRSVRIAEGFSRRRDGTVL